MQLHCSAAPTLLLEFFFQRILIWVRRIRGRQRIARLRGASIRQHRISEEFTPERQLLQSILGAAVFPTFKSRAAVYEVFVKLQNAQIFGGPLDSQKQPDVVDELIGEIVLACNKVKVC